MKWPWKSGSPTRDEFDSWHLWSDEEQKFRFRYPENWVRIPHPDKSHLMLRPRDANEAPVLAIEGRMFSPGLTMKVGSRGGDSRPAHEVFEQIKIVIPSTFNQYKHIGERIVSLPKGHRSLEITFELTNHMQRLISVMQLTVTPTRLFQFDGSVFNAEFPKYKDTLVQCLCSLEIEEAASR